MKKVKCPCGCGRSFSPKRGKKFYSTSCRVRHWHFMSAGQRVLADHERRIRELEKKLEIKKRGTGGISKG